MSVSRTKPFTAETKNHQAILYIPQQTSPSTPSPSPFYFSIYSALFSLISRLMLYGSHRLLPCVSIGFVTVVVSGLNIRCFSPILLSRILDTFSRPSHIRDEEGGEAPMFRDGGISSSPYNLLPQPSSHPPPPAVHLINIHNHEQTIGLYVWNAQ